MNIQNATGLVKKVKVNAPLHTMQNYKGLAFWDTKIDEWKSCLAKAKRTKVLGTRYSKPPYGKTIVPLYKPG